MPEREQVQRSVTRNDEDVVEETPAAAENRDHLKAELDELIDEIDDVLETNAEEFVKSYVQKGGQ